MAHKGALAFAALIAGFLGVFFTRYMVGGHSADHIVEVEIAQFIGKACLLLSLSRCFFVDRTSTIPQPNPTTLANCSIYDWWRAKI
jgi:hypothetical protein